jgi:hypothetical protein
VRRRSAIHRLAGATRGRTIRPASPLHRSGEGALSTASVIALLCKIRARRAIPRTVARKRSTVGLELEVKRQKHSEKESERE